MVHSHWSLKRSTSKAFKHLSRTTEAYVVAASKQGQKVVPWRSLALKSQTNLLCVQGWGEELAWQPGRMKAKALRQR